MAEGSDAVALPGIAALPPTTTRQIGSGQVLVDPSSVVKELIDNALDARAKSIFVDITANTIDSIQVKDDGHGIPSDDRPLVCRRYCTSKIRDFHDLRDVGGKWLGFRGEALSSMAEMSGTFHVTTRVEGEPVAVKLNYGRNGEPASVEHDSHPVGTTVKVTKFFEYIPVRKQTATKNSAKYLAKIRHLMQAYALARPTIRFRLRVLKAMNNNGGFVYAPKSDANIEDAVLKVIGKDCALQCDWTALEADGFEIHAFLPKPTASGPKIANQGAFVSIDARPVSSSRGTTKQMITAFKDRLRKSNPSLAGVKDPFFCINIICPPDSYDPNIEPTKDDVMFDNGDVVLGVVDKLLKSYYPEAVVQTEEVERPMSTEQTYEPQPEELSARSQTQPLASHEDDDCMAPGAESISEMPSEQPRWRSSMYGIDEDDLEFLQDSQAPVIEEEEGLRAAEVSNPWTIARMNAAIKPKQPVSNGQLWSPAKSQTGTTPRPSSPSPTITPNKASPTGPLTPQTSSRTNMVRSPLDDELEHRIQHLPPPSPERSTFGGGSVEISMLQGHEQFSIPPSGSGTSTHFVEANLQRPESRLSQFNQFGSMPHELPPPARSAPHRGQRKQQAFNNKSFTQPTRQSNDTWFGQPMSGAQPSQPACRQKRTKNPEVPLFPNEASLEQNSLYSKDNTDIRSFFGRDRQPQRSEHSQGSSFTPINPQSQSSHRGDRLSVVVSDVHQSLLGNSRASSAEPQPRSRRVRDQLLLNDDRGLSAEPHDMAEQFRAHAERESPARASSVGSEMSMLFKDRSTGINDTMHMHSDNGARPEPRNMVRQFQAYHNSFAPAPAPRPSSVGSERPSLIPQRTSQVATALDKHRLTQPSQNATEMEAYFCAHEDNATPSSAQPTSRTEPRIAPPHEKKPRRLRRRTTINLERSKSSKLPLERTPKGFHVQNLVLGLPISLQCIVKSARKLDMRSNTPEWGYAAEDAAEVFAEPVSERKIMDWVIKLDGMLYEKYERVGGADTRCELHEGIQRALDARKEMEEGIGGIVRWDRGTGGGVAEDGDVVQIADGVVADGGVKHTAVEKKKEDEEMFDDDFDVSEFVDLNAEDEAHIMGRIGEESQVQVKGEYDDDIENEMLMDL